MRRNNFLIGALAALITYMTLAAFVPRPWGWHHRYHHYYDHHNDHDDQKKSDSNY